MEKLKVSPLPLWLSCSFVIGSFFVVAFGQPAWLPECGLVAAALGYALFWRVLFVWEDRRRRFLLSLLWFSSVQMVQLSWMANAEYQGSYIYAVWLFFSLAMGLQFALFSLLIRRGNIASLQKSLAVTSVWVLMEWLRLFFYGGFSWNPVGLALASHVVPMQLASIAGVYGLSFFVILTNILALRIWSLSDQLRPLYAFVLVASLPYIFGWGHLAVHEQRMEAGDYPTLNIRLIHSERLPHMNAMGPHDTPRSYGMRLWIEAIDILAKEQSAPCDLLVFPEGFVPYGTHQPLYRRSWVERELLRAFGQNAEIYLPEKISWVSNGQIARALATILDVDLVVGLDTVDGERVYNSAHHFSPLVGQVGRYDKRILIPFGEYIPHEWGRSVAARYGITDSFAAGAQASVTSGKRTGTLGLTICYEETCGDVVRESRLGGANLLVNVSNDVWFPEGKLGEQHFHHGRLRSVEGGLPLVRACNAGWTAAVDSLGRIQAIMTKQNLGLSTLNVQLLLYNYWTPYTYVGDGLIIGLCFTISLLAARFRQLEF